MQGIASILALPEDKNIKGTKIESSALSFYVTEIGLNFTQEEVWIPKGLASWATQMDSLVYTNKANSNNYVLQQMFKNFPEHLLTLHTTYGELSKDFFATFRINTDKEVVLIQKQVELM
jgi:hypothetical protein